MNGRNRTRSGGLLIRERLPAELSAGAVAQLACLSRPQVGSSTHIRAARGALPSRIGSLVSPPTMLSMPLAYPSTLDHRPGARRPPWRGVGARCATSVTVNLQAKVTRTYTRAGRRRTVEDLSLSGGASIGAGTFQAEHHLLVDNWLAAFRNKEGDPLGRPYLRWCLR